ncbi:hypothetical protein LCGC14_0706280 [marine sediment metagenome]|uniref:Uncharacterized protein n=2 Tax=root TaxID=1 RepID=A0A0F9T2A8_9ZZZZ
MESLQGVFMKLFLQIIFVLCSSLSLEANSEIIHKKPIYEGNLTWTVDDITIKRTNITDTKMLGPFELVSPESGKLVVSYDDNKDSEILVTTTDMKGKDIYTFYSKGLLPFLWKAEFKTKVINGEEPMVVYLVKKQIAPEYQRWQIKTDRAAEQLSNYLVSPAHISGRGSPPDIFYAPEPLLKHKYKIIKEYQIDIGSSESQDNDYRNAVNSERWKSAIKNAFIVLASLVSVFLMWYLFKKLKTALYKVKQKASEKIKSRKSQKEQKEIRKIAKTTAISETIKNEMSKPDNKDLTQLRLKIAESIEAGDHEQVDTLLKLAERLKKLDQ